MESPQKRTYDASAVLEIRRDDSGSLALCIHLRPDDPHVVVEGDEMIWYPSSENRSLLMDAFEIFSDSESNKQLMSDKKSSGKRPNKRDDEQSKGEASLKEKREKSIPEEIIWPLQDMNQRCSVVENESLSPNVITHDISGRIVTNRDGEKMHHHIYVDKVNEESIIERVLSKQKQKTRHS